ncbi:MAG: hypothetical protein WA208_04085, partial [Thermoanaerobaculia bacterium]
LERLAAARGVDPAALRLAYVRPEHAGINVVWKDVSRGMAAAVLNDVIEIAERTVPLIANQTLYLLDAPTLEEAHGLAAVLNSTVFDAMLVAVAERAKDAHYRCFGRTVAGLAMPRGFSDASDALSREAKQLQRGRGNPEALDRYVAGLYGVSPDELDQLRRFVSRRTGAC